MNAVEYREAKPNAMFSPQLTALLRFATYRQAVACAECGRKRKAHWTMLCPFRATSLTGVGLEPGDLRAPGEPVCSDHPLAPAIAAELIGCGVLQIKTELCL